jgi:hypothetical protein
MSISKQYTKEINGATNYSATWLPNVIVSPGDVGRITDYQYQPLTTLKDLNIQFDVVPGSVQADFDYSSTDSVSVHIKAAGQAPLTGSSIAKADAGINIKFSRDNAVVFRISRGKSTRIKDPNSLAKEILSRYDKGNWKKDMVVVMEVVSAASATIVISKGNNAEIDLLAHGKIGSSKLDLADLEANFQVLKESNISTKIIASKALTPLFKPSGIKERIFRKTIFREKDKNKERGPGFGDVDYQDFSS